MFMDAPPWRRGRDKCSPLLLLSLLVFPGIVKIPLMRFADKFIVARAFFHHDFFPEPRGIFNAELPG
jgi:hypothetical protein